MIMKNDIKLNNQILIQSNLLNYYYQYNQNQHNQYNIISQPFIAMRFDSLISQEMHSSNFEMKILDYHSNSQMKVVKQSFGFKRNQLTKKNERALRPILARAIHECYSQFGPTCIEDPTSFGRVIFNCLFGAIQNFKKNGSFDETVLQILALIIQEFQEMLCMNKLSYPEAVKLQQSLGKKTLYTEICKRIDKRKKKKKMSQIQINKEISFILFQLFYEKIQLELAMLFHRLMEHAFQAIKKGQMIEQSQVNPENKIDNIILGITKNIFKALSQNITTEEHIIKKTQEIYKIFEDFVSKVSCLRKGQKFTLMNFPKQIRDMFLNKLPTFKKSTQNLDMVLEISENERVQKVEKMMAPMNENKSLTPLASMEQQIKDDGEELAPQYKDSFFDLTEKYLVNLVSQFFKKPILQMEMRNIMDEYIQPKRPCYPFNYLEDMYGTSECEHVLVSQFDNIRLQNSQFEAEKQIKIQLNSWVELMPSSKQCSSGEAKRTKMVRKSKKRLQN